MTVARGLLLALVASVALTAASHVEAAPAQPRVTRVRIQKAAHTLELYAKDTLVARYSVAIGPGGSGPKKQEGDMVTPVGRYRITSHHPSKYKVFLHVDYPNAQDRARFAELKRRGELPRSATIGGAIGIHGPPVSMPAEDKPRLKERDWTAGCIAVNEDEIVTIAKLVADGTVVDIED